ncbi:MAG: hypothetical protein WCO06_02880 [Candidatus Roizmanbacteria bacterium]
MPPDGTLTSSGTVRADKYGYTQTGVHTVFKDLWGIYTIGVRSYDASGNVSVSTKILERIKPTPTPEPTKESVYEEVTTSGGTTYYTTGQVKGTKTVYTTQTVNQTVTKTVTKIVTQQVKKPCDWSFNIFDSNNCVNVWATDMWQTVTKKVTETVTQVVQKTVQVAQTVTNIVLGASIGGLPELAGGVMNGAKTVATGLVDAAITLQKAKTALNNLAGNASVAIIASIESPFNGKSFNDNYNNLNVFGDVNQNLTDVKNGVIVGAVTAITVASTVGLVAVGVPAVAAGLIITGVATAGGIGYNTYQGVQNKMPLADALKVSTCGKLDATPQFCVGNVIGQFATGELIGLVAGKGLSALEGTAGGVKSAGTIGTVTDEIANSTKVANSVDNVANVVDDATKATTKSLIPKTPEEIAVIKEANQKAFEEVKQNWNEKSEKPFEDLYYHEQETALALMKEGKKVTALKEGNINGERYVDFSVEESSGKTTITRSIEAKHIESSNLSAINRNILDAQDQLLNQTQSPNEFKQIEINLNYTDITPDQALIQIQNMRSRLVEVVIRKGDIKILVPNSN